MRWYSYILLCLLLVASAVVPGLIAARYVAIGEGPDELAHIDYTFSMLVHRGRPHDVSASLFEPGIAPTGQGHQPPLSYWLGSRVLSLFLSPSEIGSFIDYQAGIAMSSEGWQMGGLKACNYRMDPSRAKEPEVARFRRAIIALRIWNATLFALSLLGVFALGRVLFPHRPVIAFAMAAMHGGIPTAIWRSAYVTNDNLLATLGTITFLLAAAYIVDERRRTWFYWCFGAMLSAASFLTKYNGITCLGMILVAILLRQDSVPRKLTGGAFVTAVFIALCAPDLLENLRLDHDLFSQSAIAQAFPYLYQPSSLVDLLQKPHFFSSLLSRYWVTMHNLGVLDPHFQLWKADIWNLILLAAISGLCLSFLFRRRSTKIPLNCFLLSLLTLVGAICVLVYYNLSFPMPCGRYLHMTIAPVVLLLVTGFFGWARLVSPNDKTAEILVLSATLAIFIFGQHTTFSYLKSRYANCREATALNMPGGSDALASDIDGDGTDELLFYHRMAGRFFIARFDGKHYAIEKQWTRAVGLPGDDVLSGDLTGDNLAELLLWRPVSRSFFVIDGNEIIQHKSQLFLSPDRAVDPHELRFPARYRRTTAFEPFLADLDLNGYSDPFLFQRPQGRWLSFYQKGRTATIDLIGDYKQHGTAGGHPLFIRLGEKRLVGAYDSRLGQLRLASLVKNEPEAKVHLGSRRHLLPIDIDGDGADEILSWQKHQTCFEIGHLDLADQSSSPKQVSISRTQLCLPPAESTPLDAHHKFFPVKTGQFKGSKLAAYDRRTGIVTIMGVEPKKSPTTTVLWLKTIDEFDPGFLASRYRILPYVAPK